jgi:glycosyltransferase involved in cell wall biosynthesis
MTDAQKILVKRVESKQPDKASGTIAFVQNYYSPHQHAVFEHLARSGTDLTVYYLQSPEDEGRRWGGACQKTTYTVVRCPSFTVGPFVFFWLRPEPQTVVLLDNNPTNLCMLFWAFVLKLEGKRLLLWEKHIPDRFKPRVKQLYQRICSKILCAICDTAIVFSDMTKAYLRSLPTKIPTKRMICVVPAAGGPVVRRSGPIRSFGYIGAGSNRKNVTALIEAFAALGEADASLHMAGMAPMPVGTTKRIRWWGYVDGELREEFYRSIDVMVLPSLADPWGLVVNEALQRGCLCAVSTACGSAELARSIDPRLVFEPRVRDIEDCLRTLLSLSQAEIASLREKCEAIIAPYTIDNGAKILSTIISEEIRNERSNGHPHPYHG